MRLCATVESPSEGFLDAFSSYWITSLVADEGVDVAVGGDDADVPAVGDVHRLVGGDRQSLLNRPRFDHSSKNYDIKPGAACTFALIM